MTKVIPSATGAEAVDCFVATLLAMTEEKKDAPRNDVFVRGVRVGKNYPLNKRM